jgi:hypothetical protein
MGRLDEYNISYLCWLIIVSASTLASNEINGLIIYPSIVVFSAVSDSKFFSSECG